MAKKKPQKPLTKTEIMNSLAESTGLSKKDVTAVLDGLTDLIQDSMSKNGAGVFTLPGLMKIQRIHKPATKETTRPNPFSPGEMMVVKAKPARNDVKIRVLKGLKDMV